MLAFVHQVALLSTHGHEHKNHLVCYTLNRYTLVYPLVGSNAHTSCCFSVILVVITD